MNKQDLEWFIKDNLDYTFESANEEYPAEINIDYEDLATKLQEEFYTKEEMRIICWKLSDFILSPNCNGGSDIYDWIDHIAGAKAVREYSKTVASNAIKGFISYFKQYAREDSFDQLCWDCAVDMESIDFELDAAFEEYQKEQNGGNING